MDEAETKPSAAETKAADGEPKAANGEPVVKSATEKKVREFAIVPSGYREVDLWEKRSEIERSFET